MTFLTKMQMSKTLGVQFWTSNPLFPLLESLFDPKSSHFTRSENTQIWVILVQKLVLKYHFFLEKKGYFVIFGTFLSKSLHVFKKRPYLNFSKIAFYILVWATLRSNFCHFSGKYFFQKHHFFWSTFVTFCHFSLRSFGSSKRSHGTLFCPILSKNPVFPLF